MNDSVSHKGTYIELSEHRNYLELSNLVCFYNEASLNSLQLDYGETDEQKAETLQKAQTLCLMPVYAKVTVNAQNEPTFAGHEAVRKANGEVVYKTVPIGVHESVAIEDHEVEIPSTGETKTLPCLVAKQRIWSRNKNAVAAIKRLFAEGHLHNSFEMEVSQYVYDNGVRHATDYEFTGNAFLASDSILHGASVKPAYGNSARVTEIAQEEPDYELELAQALAKDMEENKDEVKEMLDNENSQAVEETTVVEEPAVNEEPTVEESAEGTHEAAPETQEATPAQNEEGESQDNTEEATTQENSAMTDYDIRCDLTKKYQEKHEGHYSYLSFLFPEEHVAWFHSYDMRETQFVQVSYSVEDNQVVLGDEAAVEIALPIRELSSAYETAKSEVETLTQEVAELKPFKEQVEAQQAAEKQAAHEKVVAGLRTMAEKANCFTAEELSAMNDLFEQERTNDVKAAIFDKQFAMMDNNKVETSTTEEMIEQPKANLEHESSGDRIGSVRRFLNS